MFSGCSCATGPWPGFSLANFLAWPHNLASALAYFGLAWPSLATGLA
jgi:hypothetical protein